MAELPVEPCALDTPHIAHTYPREDGVLGSPWWRCPGRMHTRTAPDELPVEPCALPTSHGPHDCPGGPDAEELGPPTWRCPGRKPRPIFQMRDDPPIDGFVVRGEFEFRIPATQCGDIADEQAAMDHVRQLVEPLGGRALYREESTEAQLRAEHAERAARLRAAAAGRRVYAGPEYDGGNPKIAEMRAVLLAQADTLDLAARIVEGDLGPLYGLLPSWQWTDEMNDALRDGTPR